jgi:hypothetical protein
MFSAPSRTAQACVAMAAAAFETQYSARGTATAVAFDEVTVTMEWTSAGSRSRARSRFAKACVRKNTAFALTDRQRSQLSSLTSSGSPRLSTPTPALLTSVVSGPSAASTRSSAGAWAARSDTSKATPTARAPSAFTAVTAAASSASSAGPFSATAKPFRASAFAAPSPIPRLDPVTSATCPFMQRLRS